MFPVHYSPMYPSTLHTYVSQYISRPFIYIHTKPLYPSISYTKRSSQFITRSCIPIHRTPMFHSASHPHVSRYIPTPMPPSLLHGLVSQHTTRPPFQMLIQRPCSLIHFTPIFPCGPSAHLSQYISSLRVPITPHAPPPQCITHLGFHWRAQRTGKDS